MGGRAGAAVEGGGGGSDGFAVNLMPPYNDIAARSISLLAGHSRVRESGLVKKGLQEG